MKLFSHFLLLITVALFALFIYFIAVIVLVIRDLDKPKPYTVYYSFKRPKKKVYYSWIYYSATDTMHVFRRGEYYKFKAYGSFENSFAPVDTLKDIITRGDFIPFTKNLKKCQNIHLPHWPNMPEK